MIVSTIRRQFPNARTLLEVGCGTGHVRAALQDALPSLELAGSEISTELLAVARGRLPDVELMELDANDSPPRTFDIVGAFDVLEHIADDERAVARLFEATAPGGGAILLLPQHPWLWSAADEFAHHLRRYTRREAVAKLERAGFRVAKATSFVTSLLPLMFVVRKARGGDPDNYGLASELVPPRPLNGLCERMLDGERRLIERGISLPLGGSLLVVARRE